MSPWGGPPRLQAQVCPPPPWAIFMFYFLGSPSYPLACYRQLTSVSLGSPLQWDSFDHPQCLAPGPGGAQEVLGVSVSEGGSP